MNGGKLLAKVLELAKICDNQGAKIAELESRLVALENRKVGRPRKEPDGEVQRQRTDKPD